MHLGVFTVAQKLVYSWYLMGETPLLPYKHVNIVYFVTQDVKYNIFSVPKTKRKFWITFELTRFRTIRGDSCFRLVEIYSKMKTKITAGLWRPLFRPRPKNGLRRPKCRPAVIFIYFWSLSYSNTWNKFSAGETPAENSNWNFQNWSSDYSLYIWVHNKK